MRLVTTIMIITIALIVPRGDLQAETTRLAQSEKPFLAAEPGKDRTRLTPFPVRQELPTSLRCISNAKAARDYDFAEKQWTGQKGYIIFGHAPFQILTIRQKKESPYLRDRIFSELNTQTPKIISVTLLEDGDMKAEEFIGRVLNRFEDSVFVVWTNDYKNKLWQAVIDLRHRQVVISQVYRGVTSVGGELETLDCH